MMPGNVVSQGCGAFQFYRYCSAYKINHRDLKHQALRQARTKVNVQNETKLYNDFNARTKITKLTKLIPTMLLVFLYLCYLGSLSPSSPPLYVIGRY